MTVSSLDNHMNVSIESGISQSSANKLATPSTKMRLKGLVGKFLSACVIFEYSRATYLGIVLSTWMKRWFNVAPSCKIRFLRTFCTVSGRIFLALGFFLGHVYDANAR